MRFDLRGNRAASAVFAVMAALLVAAAASGHTAFVAPVYAEETPAADQPGETTNKVYLPLVINDYIPILGTRIGFGTGTSVDQFPTIGELNAGWYVNWDISAAPPRPGGMEYMQMVRMHQKRTCGSRVSEEYDVCPYVQPYAYELGYDGALTQSAIVNVAKLNLGSTWLIGNECDRRDWEGGGQDEMLPEVYVEAFHQLAGWIKNADPTAKIAICGLIQATPLRLAYLTTIWDLYKQKYGEMPVDVWNVHNFIMQENGTSWGARIPPGSDAANGSYVNEHYLHIDMNTFDEQIRAYRKWMRDRGQQNKPLIVTEYGVLYPWFTAEEVHNFMLASFDYFATEKDCNLSTVDDCRLVQRWAWFSLDDIGWNFNSNGALFNKHSKQILPAGEKYRDYVSNNLQILNDYHP